MWGYPVYRVPTVTPGPTSGEAVNPQVGPISFPHVSFLKFTPDSFTVVVRLHQRMRGSIYLVRVRQNIRCG
jgi:hypothetical protein